jgi:hypothetical protein
MREKNRLNTRNRFRCYLMSFAARIVQVPCFLSLAAGLQGQEMRPDFAKLAPVPLCDSAVEFARTNDIPLEGIDALGPEGHLNPGDSITALITLFEKGGHKAQWLLCTKAAEPTPAEKARAPKPPMVYYVGAGDRVEFTRAHAPVTMRLLGPFVEPIGKAKNVKSEEERARISVNQGFLGIGLEQAAAATHRIMKDHLHGGFSFRKRPFTDAEAAEGRKSMAGLQLSLQEQRGIVGANLALESYTRIVQETPKLDDLLYKVVKPPSFWSVVSHFGVNISLELENEYVAPTSPKVWSLSPDTRCYTYPLALRVNGQPALTTTLVVTQPRPPLLACAGVVGLLAENPKDKETYLTLRVISARRHKDSQEAVVITRSATSP